MPPIGFVANFQGFLNFQARRRAPLFRQVGGSSQRFLWQALFWEKVLHPLRFSAHSAQYLSIP
ncbi:MAG: hypothetical protein A3F82_07830 [Deltaproteobacteria bacterium RIFCSPLOWO2_12_FULL_44_12]|nr:MAG: hypothetical protein A2712_10665 [Deltaproteobacteria bacterium RIFCSPHIGHO2_01_FULL_43_49]OGQ15567.1 MAG: hypothetical protein A3D22_11195 [Deltaproteobacteria bacterium RIFCSPHIGHO2_02_FULL_44_53]OGQ32373.1 MAG: hypothetical protein A2979_01040 [Deltaproteobacteria bacterium RIFCSPLOWO2_01_FULL_45_74]OGQ44015.1 MAG: hypothetical protein A3I70_04940 [Deltaproteobacteria bacterium RIFCSPLOWO2_02_FULL_44_34]OGQ71070.1 MAG: hypothetical protein A3F82_07830 [Deltaproteobacteria bacterium R